LIFELYIDLCSYIFKVTFTIASCYLLVAIYDLLFAITSTITITMTITIAVTITIDIAITINTTFTITITITNTSTIAIITIPRHAIALLMFFVFG